MKPSEVLRAAATRLETHGWCQGSLSKDDRRCAKGALNHVGWDGPYLTWLDACEEFLDDVGSRCIADWNDAPGRTAEEVIAQLRRTAERLEGEGR